MTENGKVWSKRSGEWRELATCPTPRGYPKVKLTKGFTVLVHLIVAAAYLGERPEGMTVNHKNGDKQDASASNLEYVTQGENNRHAWRSGLQRSGWDTRRARAVHGFAANGAYRIAA